EDKRREEVELKEREAAGQKRRGGENARFEGRRRNLVEIPNAEENKKYGRKTRTIGKINKITFLLIVIAGVSFAAAIRNTIVHWKEIKPIFHEKPRLPLPTATPIPTPVPIASPTPFATTTPRFKLKPTKTLCSDLTVRVLDKDNQ